MSTPERNAEAIHAVADWIDANPERYWQANWATSTSCGTAYCIGGTACHLAGGKLIVFAELWETADGKMMAAGTWAVELLGLGAQDAKYLFGAQWKPAPHLTVAEALHELADGADLFDVSHPSVRAYAAAAGAHAAEHA